MGDIIRSSEQDMGEWKTVEINDMPDMLLVYYPSGTFKLGMDSNNVLYVVPSHLELDRSMRIIGVAVDVECIPECIEGQQICSTVFIWADAFSDGLLGEGDLEDLLAVPGSEQEESGNAMEISIIVPEDEKGSAEEPQEKGMTAQGMDVFQKENESLRREISELRKQLENEQSDMAYLVEEIKKVKTDNLALRAECELNREQPSEDVSGTAAETNAQIICRLDEYLKDIYSICGGDASVLPDDILKRAEAVVRYMKEPEG